MATYAFCAPVLSGMRDEIISLTAQLKGDRRSDAEAARRAAGIHREQVFLQQTPMGDVALIVWDTDDFAKSFKALMNDTSEFGRWFTGTLEKIHGMDMKTQTVPHVTVTGEWKDGSWSFADLDSWAFAFPVKDLPAAKRFFQAVLGDKREQFVATRLEHGVKRVTFCQFETPDGNFVVNYIEGEAGSFPKAFKTTATSDDPFYAWWRSQVQQFAAVPMFQGGDAPKVQPLLDLQVGVPARA